MSTVEVAREEIYRKFAHALEQSDAHALAMLHSSDAEVQMPFLPTAIKGREAIRGFNESFFKAIQDIKVKTLNVATKGDIIAAEFVVTARHSGALELPTGTLAATNRQIMIPSANIFRINREGQIAEARAYFDTASLLKQLGA